MSTFIPIVQIEVGKRQRQVFDEEEARDLETSIMEKGLLHAIGVEQMPGGFELRFGERRLRAIKKLHSTSKQFFHAGELVPMDCIPATILSDLSNRARLEVEFEENARRSSLTWQERVEALAEIGKMYESEPVPIRDAKAAALTGLSLKRAPIDVAQATLIKAAMAVPAVASARSVQEAYKATLKHNENNFVAELTRRSLKSTAGQPDLAEARRGDMTKIVPGLDEGQFDAIICDPPYGYDADTTFGAKVETKHLYRDDEVYAKEIYKVLLTEGFRITKARAHIFLFCKPTLFSFLHDLATRMLWTPFPSPVLWKKGPGYAPWGNLGFRRNYEMIFWACKGQKGLNYLVEDIMEVGSSRTKTHGAEKPVELMEYILNAATLPGDYILDPCMGSGSTLIAARNLKRRALGIEMDESYFNLAMSRIAEAKKADGSP